MTTNANRVPARDITAFRGELLPALRAAIRSGYFSFAVEGACHVPPDEPVIYAANHAGWAALDGFMFALAVWDHRGPQALPYAVIEDLAFKVPGLRTWLQRLGTIPASWLRHPERLAGLPSLGVFPEGSEGNCKPLWQAYQLRRWRTGFVRLAVTLRRRVVPVAILGGEECLPVAWTVQFLKSWLGTVASCPLCLVPLPSHWKVIFLPPVEVPSPGEGGELAPAVLAQVAAGIRAQVQQTLDRETASHRLARLGRWWAGHMVRLA